VALSTTDFGEFLASFCVFCVFWLQLDRLVTGEGFVCFHELIKTSQLFGSDLSFAGTLPIAIFSSKVEAYSEGIIVDGYIYTFSKVPWMGVKGFAKVLWMGVYTFSKVL